ncbi:MAG: glycosyltransferase [Gemmatimonadetes bacterium]|nr:glycosyltransferase [Gemmatimonadota bacterium]
MNPPRSLLDAVRPTPVPAAPPRHLAPPPADARPRVGGKFLFAGEEKLYLRGVTYGPFRPDANGCEYGTPAAAERDFARMAAHGVNSLRTYTVPPRWLLDAAHGHGLRVMVGLPWEQHVAFLDERGRARDIEARVRRGVRACAGHPAVLCYAVGNEIPAGIVRWHSARRVETFLQRLYRAAREEDTGGLVTYVNYPSTEYLDLSFADLLCFNVYLERQERLEAYLARLHNLAGDRPLVLAEVGLDSRRNGEAAQARSLEWQLRAAFAGGCAGAFAFAWTDEWHRGGYDIGDWDFGLTDRGREPKPALAAVGEVFAEVPVPAAQAWPRVSVVVCAYNAQDTLHDTLRALAALRYPDFETIVVDDGSTDATPRIAAGYDCRLIRTPNRGLSAARNTGWQAATGEIVAYLDADAYPDPEWLTYLAMDFVAISHAGVGGPNVPPPGTSLVADCVANAPGGPVHVLLADREAEHIPGCNMAFRRAALEAVGGFDPRFRVAGDDVDLCWRLQDRGWTLGFAPAAMVWHHRRGTVRGYWRQQVGYGRAEAMLERKWPDRYNGGGHVQWAGRIYGDGLLQPILPPPGRVYGGVWGTAPFQRLYQPAPGALRSLPLMPEWYLGVFLLAALSLVGLLWPPLLVALPLAAAAVLAQLGQALRGGMRACFRRPMPPAAVVARRGLTTLLHLLQPLARLRGRLAHGITPWRRQGVRGLALPRPRVLCAWSERWRDPANRLRELDAALREERAVVRHGGDTDRWDLELRDGTLGSVRVRMAVEEHGGGRQLVRLRAWPRPASIVLWLALGLLVLGTGAAADGAWAAAAVLTLAAGALLLRVSNDCASALAALYCAAARTAADERRRES